MTRFFRLLPLPLLLAIGTARAAAPATEDERGPSSVAVSFLIDVARDRVDLDTDTSISPTTTQEKRASIRARLSHLATELAEGDLRAIREEVDGDLAGVLVSQIIDFDPNRVRVHAVALRKLEGEWRPAPVPASFENTGLTYLPDLSKRAAGLEAWLLRERGVETQRLRENVLGDLLDDIAAAMSRDELHEAGPNQLAFAFIGACRDRNLPRALACLGGLEDPLPDNWQDTLKLTSDAFRRPETAPGAWERLLSPTALRTVLSEEIDDEGASVRLGEIEPAGGRPGRPEVAELSFSCSKGAGGLWRLALPLWLLEDPEDGFATVDSESREAREIPRKIFEDHPPGAFATPAELAKSLRAAFDGQEFAPLLKHLARPESDSLETLGLISRLWNGFLASPRVFPLVLDATAHEERGRLLLTEFDARSPEITALIVPVDLVLVDGSWLVAPWVDDLKAEPDFDPWLNQWSLEGQRLGADAWLQRLDLHAPLGGLAADTAPTEEQARQAINAWLEASRACDPLATLATGAAFDDRAGGGKLLKAIGRDFRTDTDCEILAIHRSGRWAAASVRHQPTEDGAEPFDSLYPIVSTPKGPRVLAEAILENATNRSREYLNDLVWQRLAERLPQAAVDELRELAKSHAALNEPR